MFMGNSLLTLSQWCKSFDSTAKVQTTHMIGRKVVDPKWRDKITNSCLNHSRIGDMAPTYSPTSECPRLRLKR